MDNTSIAIRLSLLLLVLVAAVYDFRFRRIPNWLNASGLVLGFGLNLLLFQSKGLAIAGEGLLLAAAVYLPLYLLRGMGAGDVKLMAAIGSLVGPWPWFQIFLATAILGGVAAVTPKRSACRMPSSSPSAPSPPWCRTSVRHLGTLWGGSPEPRGTPGSRSLFPSTIPPTFPNVLPQSSR